MLTNILNEAGGLPTSNFSAGTFEFADAIGGETQRDDDPRRAAANVSHGCHTGCVIQCSRYWVDKDGHYKTKGPEYETAWSMGADCGIADLDDIAELDRACGDLGLDTIEMGATLAVYMDSGAVEFGDAAGALAALKAGLEPGNELRVLWDGAEATGKKFGVERIPVDQASGAAGLRSATHPGDRRHVCHHPHGRRPHRRLHHHRQHPRTWAVRSTRSRPKARRSCRRTCRSPRRCSTALGFCIFVAFPVLDIPEAFSAIHEMAAAHTGEQWGVDELMQLGREVLTMERKFNERAGFTAADDRLPAFFYKDELPAAQRGVHGLG